MAHESRTSRNREMRARGLAPTISQRLKGLKSWGQSGRTNPDRKTLRRNKTAEHFLGVKARKY